MTFKRFFLVAIGLLAFWYLFLKQSDYIIRFKVPTSPGVTYALIKDWSIELEKQEGTGIKILKDKKYQLLQLELKKSDRTYELFWKLQAENDSLTQVSLGFRQPGKRIWNRITAPFFKSEFKEDIIRISKDFKEGVKLNLTDKFKVNKVVLDKLPEMNYAFVEVKKISVFNKAEQMMKHNYELIHQVDELKIARKGFPFVMVTDWDIDKNEIDYRLCIEIDPVDKPTLRGTLKFDRLAAQPSLKTIYNGNYIYSDKAWFALHDFALRKSYEVSLKPVEFFHNNPFTDTKEIEWVTEVYLPLSQ